MSQYSETASELAQVSASATPDSDTSWSTVSEEEYDEIKIVFETIGDEFIGVYIGQRKVETDESNFVQHRFQVGEDRYFINGNWSLNQGMSHVTKGQVARVTYVSDKETGMETPMRVYRVDVKGRVRAARR